MEARLSAASHLLKYMLPTFPAHIKKIGNGVSHSSHVLFVNILFDLMCLASFYTMFPLHVMRGVNHEER